LIPRLWNHKRILNRDFNELRNVIAKNKFIETVDDPQDEYENGMMCVIKVIFSILISKSINQKSTIC